MTKTGLEVLELFAEVSEQYTDAQTYRLREGYVPIVKHDICKRQWREANKELQLLYSRRHYARKVGKPLPPIQLVKVEIFWEGQSFWYAKPHDSERIGGPFETLHKAWKHADRAKIEVIGVTTTRGNRGPK